jgi:hypothetical protein
MKRVRNVSCALVAMTVAATSACTPIKEERVAWLEKNLRLLDQTAATKLQEQDERLTALTQELATLKSAPVPKTEPLSSTPSAPAPATGASAAVTADQTGLAARIGELETAYQNMRTLFVELQQRQQSSEASHKSTTAPVEPPAKANAPAPASATMPAPYPEYELAALVGEGRPGVTQVNESTYTVARDWLVAEVRMWAANPKKPKFPVDKKTGGIKLAGINAQHLLGKLFLKNNDVIIAVAGKPVSDIAEIVPILHSLEKPKVEVTLVRAKEELRYSYELVP